MYQIVHQEQGAIELGVDGSLNRAEFGQMAHQLESLATTHGPLSVMFDLTRLEDWDKTIALDEIEFYRENRDALRRVAVVSDDKKAKFFTQLFGKISDTDVKHFPTAELGAARGWTFASRLP
jgi:hypothetical protein